MSLDAVYNGSRLYAFSFGNAMRAEFIQYLDIIIPNLLEYFSATFDTLDDVPDMSIIKYLCTTLASFSALNASRLQKDNAGTVYNKVFDMVYNDLLKELHIYKGVRNCVIMLRCNVHSKEIETEYNLRSFDNLSEYLVWDNSNYEIATQVYSLNKRCVLLRVNGKGNVNKSQYSII